MQREGQPEMRRVLVIGSGGAGKSTLAAQLSERLQLPLVHLDALYWRSGWQELETAQWERTVCELASAPAWVLDGNYGGTMDVRLARCDTVVFLDLPRVQCVWRILRRWWRYRGRTRPDLAPGCPEQMSWEFISWVWTYPARRRPGVLRRLSELSSGQRAVILRSSAAVAEFLRDLHPAVRPSPSRPHL